MFQDGNRRLLHDAARVAGGKLAGAVGVLVGIRILTEFLSPEIFGEVVLFMGVIALMAATAVNPLMQAILRYYPDIPPAERAMAEFRAIGRRVVWQAVLAWGLPALVLLVIYAYVTGGNVWVGPVTVLLFAVEAQRQLGISFLNAARRQGRFALWQAVETWGRPIVAVGVLMLAGGTVTMVLLGYLIATLIALAVFSENTRGTDGLYARLRVLVSGCYLPSRGESHHALNKELWAYAVPLIPAGILGWANGQADRYLVAGVIGIGQAGLYAAVYGLVSRPFLLVGGFLEDTIRPVYYQAVSGQVDKEEKRILSLWFALVMLIGLSGYILFYALHHAIAELLLAEQYRGGSWMMPWFAAGYALLIVAQVFSRICYAYGDTRAVFIGELATAGVGFTATWVLMSRFGLKGAAYAVPVYFCVLLIIMALLAWRTGGCHWKMRFIQGQVSR